MKIRFINNVNIILGIYIEIFRHPSRIESYESLIENFSISLSLRLDQSLSWFLQGSSNETKLFKFMYIDLYIEFITNKFTR